MSYEQMSIGESMNLEPERKKEPEKSPLTPLEWRVYDLIAHGPEGRIWTQEEICAEIPELNLTEAPNKNGKGNRCRQLHDVMDDINGTDPTFHLKVISTKDYTYAVACREVSEALALATADNGRKKLKRAYAILKKAKMEGQGQLLNAKLNAMDLSDEHAFYAAFLK